MRAQSLGQEDPLEEKMATYTSILAWKILWTKGAWWVAVHGVPKSEKCPRTSMQSRRRGRHTACLVGSTRPIVKAKLVLR